jgi:hypothetical protein
MSDKDYLDGARAAQYYYHSQAYGSLTRYVKAEDAMRLFWPPVEESMMQVQTPLPKPRRDWIKGFKEEQVNILNELENES